MNTDPKTDLDAAIATLITVVLKPYGKVPLEMIPWFAARIRRGILDDLEDLERDHHIVAKEKVPW